MQRNARSINAGRMNAHTINARPIKCTPSKYSVNKQLSLVNDRILEGIVYTCKKRVLVYYSRTLKKLLDLGRVWALAPYHQMLVLALIYLISFEKKLARRKVFFYDFLVSFLMTTKTCPLPPLKIHMY